MCDHRLLLPALMQDGTLISIHTFKWPTVFIKDTFFFRTRSFAFQKNLKYAVS